MRYLKVFGLTTIAAAALVAILVAGSASATVLCSTTMNACVSAQKWSAGTLMDFSLKGGTTLRFSLTLRLTLEKGGGAAETVSAPMNQLTWSNCTFPTATLWLGNREILRVEGTSNGLVTESGFELTYNSIFTGSCVWGQTSAATFGTLQEGRPASLEVNTVLSKLPGSNETCPTSTRLIGEYTLTLPSNTTLSVSSS